MEAKRDIREWFQKIVSESNMQTELVSFSDSENLDWEVGEDRISRKDKKFYDIVFVKTTSGSITWRNPMIRQLSKNGIYAVLVLLKVNGKYLVQAKAETGNKAPGNVILTSTIQSSYENLINGKVAYASLVNKLENKLDFKSVPQDGGMLYQKNNEFIFAEIEDKNFEVLSNFFLATREEISSFAKDGLVSEHLMQLLGLLWLSELN